MKPKIPDTHTPGPWRITEGGIVVALTASGHMSCELAEVYGIPTLTEEDDRAPGLSEDECWANARLIAAAPELLDALRRIQGGRVCTCEKDHPEDDPHDDTCVHGIVERALARLDP